MKTNPSLDPVVAAAFSKQGCFEVSQGSLRIGRRRGGPRLHFGPPGRLWQRFKSSSFPAPDLFENGDPRVDESLLPPGPFKLKAARESRQVKVIADLPLFLAGGEIAGRNGIDLENRDGEREIDLWVEMLVGDVMKRCSRPGARRDPAGAASAVSRPSLAGTLEWLEKRRWETSVHGDVVQVHVSGRGYSRQARVRTADGGLVSVEMELAEIGAWSEASVRAAHVVAAAANDRLRLVRVIDRDDGEGRRLIAQVHLGRLPLCSAWLELALEALASGADLFAQEVPALADPALAGSILKASLVAVP